MIGDLILRSVLLNYEADLREGVSISAMGYCALQTQNLFVRKQKKDIKAANLLAMRTGTATHDDLFRLLYKYRSELEGFRYIVREKEVNLPTAQGSIKGHLDLMFEVGGIRYVGDLKVIDDAPFNMTNEARKHEVDQVMLYAAAMGVENCVLIYLCKGGGKKGQFKEFEFAVDRERVEFLKDKYDRIMAGKAERPFKDPSESWECGYCPYYEECWGAKVSMTRKEGVAEIDATLEEKYIAAKSAADEFQSRADELKEEIVASLDGKRGEGNALSAVFYPGKSYPDYDKKSLEAYVAPDLLKKCAKMVNRAGYYKLNIRGEK